MEQSRIGSGLMMVIIMLVAAGLSCTNYTIPGKGSGNGAKNTCEDCHTNYDNLVLMASPDTDGPVTGYGIEAPHIEPYDRVYLGGEGFEAFKSSAHYSLGCKGCHNGDNTSLDKAVAHSGDFIKHPSFYFEEKCSTCHGEITDNFTTSLHRGEGMKRKVALRSGLSVQEFDQLPAHQVEAYNDNCATCHASCGTCHVNRPPMAGGGLASGHSFSESPDMDEVCLSCHLSHVPGGEETGISPDLHMADLGFECLSCHSGHELHGNGQEVEHRYAYDALPACEDCHQGIETANNYHSMHFGDFNCQVCHSQDYNNCGSCHIDGDGLTIPAYLGFKIAANPLPEINEGFELTLVRRTPADPDNWTSTGVEAYSDFDALPTYNYATPHNLQRWTGRTQVTDGACNKNCHIRKEGNLLINKELYLFQADLLEWEINATTSITVDDKLPSSWTK